MGDMVQNMKGDAHENSSNWTTNPVNMGDMLQNMKGDAHEILQFGPQIHHVKSVNMTIISHILTPQSIAFTTFLFSLGLKIECWLFQPQTWFIDFLPLNSTIHSN